METNTTSVKTITRRIERADHECECELCGCPLYVGDVVIHFADGQNDDRPFCSSSCAMRTRAADMQSYATAKSY